MVGSEGATGVPGDSSRVEQQQTLLGQLQQQQNANHSVGEHGQQVIVIYDHTQLEALQVSTIVIYDYAGSFTDKHNSYK